MNQEQAIAKARQFANMAHGTEVGRIARETEETIAIIRNQAAARGTLMSGGTVAQIAKARADQITALLKSRLDCVLEGYELHNVVIDDQVVDGLIAELASLRSTWIFNTRNSFISDPVLGRQLVSEGSYVQLVEQNVGMHQNEVRTLIDRRRLMPKKTEEPTTSINIAYHVQGHNNRWVTNSQDHSVNRRALSRSESLIHTS